MRTMALTLAVSFLAATAAMAADCCAPAACDEPEACCAAQDCCEPACHVQKMCKVVCTTKTIKKTIWSVQCEDFCPSLPGRGPLGGLLGNCNGCGNGGCGPDACCEVECGDGCEPTGCEASCCGPLGLGSLGCGQHCGPFAGLRNREDCPPSCGMVRTKKKLLRKVIECEVPAYKCVVVCCAPACEDGCGDECGTVEEEAPAPQEAPAPEEATTDAAPMPPVVGTSYLKALTP